MAERATAILEQLRKLAVEKDLGRLTDRELLERFANHRDEAAFRALWDRHGPMVFGICRRVLSHAQDAEDSFQATFLVLAQKAAAVSWQKSAAGWLHQTAYRLALHARAAAARRVEHERRPRRRPAEDPFAEISLREAQAALDTELNALPKKYRAPLVLCYLEGVTRDEAAHQLGWSLSTLKRRLEKGLNLLRARLGRRGLTLSAVLSASLLTPSASAGTWVSLSTATLKAVLAAPGGQTASGVLPAPVAALVHRAMQQMFLAKVKCTALVLLVLGGFAFGAGALSLWLADPTPSPNLTKAAPRPDRIVGRDAFGDPLPDAVVARMGTVRLRHGHAIRSVVFSPDGTVFASAGGVSGTEDCAIRLWDAADGNEQRQFTEDHGVSSLAFAPDGKVLASGSQLGRVRLWQVESGKELRRLAEPGDPTRSESEITAIAFAADGLTVAAASATGNVRVWEAVTGRLLRELPPPGEAVRCLAFSPDASLLATADASGRVRPWHTVKGNVLRQFIGHDELINSMAFSPDGTILACGPGNNESKDYSIRLWDTATGEELRRLAGHSAGVTGLAFACDGNLLVSVGGDFSARVWETATGKPSKAIWSGYQQILTSVSFSPDGNQLAAGSAQGAVFHWSINGDKPPLESYLVSPPRAGIRLVQFADGGKTLVTASGDQLVRVWDAKAGKQLRHANCGDSLPDTSLALSADGKALAAGRIDGGIQVCELIEGHATLYRLFRQFRLLNTSVISVALSADGQTLTAVGADGRFQVWDIATGKPRNALLTQQEAAFLPLLKGRRGGGVAFSPDGKVLACGGPQNTIHLWDVQADKLISELRPPPGKAEEFDAVIPSVGCMAFSPDGKTLASVSSDQTVRLWDLATGEQRRCSRGILPPIASRCAWHAVAFSPDGKLLASSGAGQSIALYDVTNGKELTRRTGHRGDVWSLAFSPDGRLLASGSSDSTALVWDVASLIGK